jgi:hypothetical protein
VARSLEVVVATYIRGSGAIKKGSGGKQRCHSGSHNEEGAHDGLLSLPLSPSKKA